MPLCTIINRYAVDGYNYDIYIGRGTKWGNPFREGADGSRKTVIQKYRSYLLRNADLMAALPELRGKVLACSCKPKPCHGDVLVELVNALP